MKTFKVNELKHFLTIKNAVNIGYIKKILTYDPDCKPIDRISHGYSETKVQNEKGFYMRDKYRYKKKKEEKIAMDKTLFENITVSRLNPSALSVSKAFIASEQLSLCMLMFSDGQAFNYYEVKYRHVKLGGKKTPRSIWFDPAHISSFSEWLIFLFEMEIFEAYQLFKKEKTPALNPLNHFTFVQENISMNNIHKYIDNLLLVYSEKRFSGKYAKKNSKKEAIFGGEDE